MSFWNKTRKLKFGNTPAALCSLGHSHPSKLESAVCQILELRRRAGEFETLSVQSHERICCDGDRCNYKKKVESVVDFECTRQDGSTFYVESKGFETSDWRIKRRLWMHNGPGDLEIWMGSWNRPYLSEIVKVT